MNFSARSLLLLILLFSLLPLIGFQLPLGTQQPKNPIYYAVAAPQSQNTVDLESNQSFSCAPGSIIEYNVYVENKGKSVVSYTLSALSSKGYYVEVWRETDQIGGGDLQLIPPQGYAITMNADEVATLVIKVTIPSDATVGTVDNTIIRAANADLGTSDSVTVTTTVASDLPYPSTWIQLGSDPTFPTPPPIRIDIKSFYYANDGIDVFFRMAEVSKPNTIAFWYCVYLDVRAGGQQIDDYTYDYLLSSDGFLYEWNGASWVASGYPTYWQVDGTMIVLWADLANLSIDAQEIHFLACTTTNNGILKDKEGPYTILKNNISEIPVILIPILSFAVYFAISRRARKNAPEHGHILQTHW